MLGEGGWVADLFDDVLVTEGSPWPQKEQPVDGTLVSSVCSRGDLTAAMWSGGVWPVTEYLRWSAGMLAADTRGAMAGAEAAMLEAALR